MVVESRLTAHPNRAQRKLRLALGCRNDKRAPPPDYVEILLLLLGFFFIPISGDVKLAYDWIPGHSISLTLVCLFLFRIFNCLERSFCAFGT
jgi:hypothetical protein